MRTFLSKHKILSVLTSLLLTKLCVSHCPNMCSQHGICDVNGQCQCANGFRGGDCSLRVCPSGESFNDKAYSTDSAHQLEECSGRGICDEQTGRCKCASGFTGIACERTSCKYNCHHKGICLSMRQYAQNERSINSDSYNYDHTWDADKIYGCVCDLGYTGFDCSERVCPSGDDPLTSGGVQEVQLIRCSADSGELVLYFRGQHSDRIPVSASESNLKDALESIPLLGQVTVEFSEGSTLCRSDVKNIVKITFIDNFGPLPPLVSETFGMEGTAFIEIAANNPTEKMVDDYAVEYFAVKGTKENDECSNRGICDQGTGTCNCFDDGSDKYAGSDGYGNSGNRGDCGFVVNSVASTCPNSCSNNGICDDATKRCQCEEKFTGGDCSLRQCEHGWSWFSYPSQPNTAHDEWVECSNMGTCHRVSGECECSDGFFGSACEYMSCGSENGCNGHGTCLSMRNLALRQTTTEGNADPQIYGSDPNNSNTWDADRIYGCHCDDGYEGYDCSLRSCQTGKDVLSDTTAVCSNHGTCNHSTGRCECFRGWGSSDGATGATGTIEDCGHRLAFAS